MENIPLELKNKKVILLDSTLKRLLTSGNLYFIGRNEMLEWDKQVTVGRTPYKIKSWEQVVEYNEELMFNLTKLR